MIPMTNEGALSILDKATDPRNANSLTRMDYSNIQNALNHLAMVLAPKTEPEPKPSPKPEFDPKRKQ